MSDPRRPAPSILTTPGAGRAVSAPVMGSAPEPTIFEFSSPHRKGWSFRETGIPEWSAADLLPPSHIGERPPALPEVGERDLVAHYTRLASRNYSVDLGAYPLGSCTMKYNPKVCDAVTTFAGLQNAHPAQPTDQIQGWLELYVSLEQILCEVTGMARATLQPAAGAQGEMTGLLLMRAWHQAQGRSRSKVLIPDSAHGTNPASVTLAGYEVVEVPSDSRGLVDVEALRSLADDDVAGLMLTNPNTLGLFETQIEEIAEILHAHGALLYYDGANLNAIMGAVRPGDMGFDIVHMNLHKTFAVPHGGGGPGAGPVAVSQRLVDFLPGPMPQFDDATGQYGWHVPQRSIGRIHSWHGNALALARAYAYILANGGDGLTHVSRIAVLNARYMAERLSGVLEQPFSEPCMHEFVASARSLKRESNVKALDISKRFMEKGFHPPTMYFPLVVDEALMVEPTETESPQTLEAMINALEEIVAEVATDGGASAHSAPRTTPVGRVDEVLAAKQLRLRWQP